MTNTKEAIAAKVRGVAAEKRLTQAAMAGALGLSRASIVERINGRVPFTGAELFTLAQATTTPISRFFPEVVTERIVERVA